MKTEKLHFKKVTGLILLLLLFIAGVGNSVIAQATVQTDKPDYLPGELVIITGDGWEADEMITLTIEHMVFTSHPIETWTTNASTPGLLFDASYIIDPWDLGETFLLTATGQASGYVATTTFTDGDFLGSIEIGIQQGYFLQGLPGSVTFPILVTRSGPGNGNFDVRVCITENFPDYFTYIFDSPGYQPNQGIIHFNTGQNSATGTMTVMYDGSPANQSDVWTFSIMGYVLPNNQNTQHSCSNPTNDNATGTFEGTLAFGLPPSITCPAPIIANTDAGLCSAVVNYEPVVTGDPTPIIIYSFNGVISGTGSGTGSGSTFPKGITTVTLTASNGIPPDATCSFTVTVEDHQAPSFTAPDNITIYTDATCDYNASVSVTGDVVNETDNCPGVLDATFNDDVSDGSCEGSHVITRTWSLIDASGNAAATQDQIITVSDNTAPTFTAPDDTEIFTDANCLYDASVGETGDVTDEDDNCTTTLDATFADAIVDGPCEGSHIITRTWSLVDDCGNAAATQDQIITVLDDIVPTFTAPADIEIFTDADCAYDASTALTGDVTDENDNCTSNLNPDFYATFSDVTTAGTCEDDYYYLITRTWNLVDDCGNAAPDQVQIITVKIPTSLEVFTSAQSANYFDDITLFAVIGNICKNDGLGGTVEFFFEGNSVGTANAYPIPYDEEGFEDNLLRATLIHKLVEMPETYTVTAIFTPDCGKYTDSNDEVGTELIIYPREASPQEGSAGFYTGPLYSWTTGPNSSTATITLSAVITDGSQPTGDVRGARVTFYYNDNGTLTPIPSAQNLPVNLIDMTDGTVGAASAIVQFNIGNWNALDFYITVGISGGYNNNPLDPESRALITVSKPVPGGYIMGGGTIANTEYTNGLIKGAMNATTSYSFDVKYNKKGTNPQGAATVIIYSYYDANGLLDDDIHIYHVKSNAIATLVVNKPFDPNAYFSAKATLKEELEDGTMVSIEGNNTLQLWMTDPGNDEGNATGVSLLGIQLNRKAGGIWFSSNWTGTNTIEQTIIAGELYITPASAAKNAEIMFEPIAGAVNSDELTVYPNPTTSNATFRFIPQTDSKATLEIFNMNGTTVEVLYEGNVTAGQTYEINYQPGNLQAGMQLYRMILDEKVLNGKLMIQH